MSYLNICVLMGVLHMCGKFISDSGSEPREEMTDSDSSPAPYATTKEKYLNGLLKGPALSRRHVDIGYVQGSQRTAYAAKDFYAGDFVCEYGAVRRVHKRGTDEGEERNADLGVGCYCLDARYKGVMYTFDAAPKCNDPGRYVCINAFPSRLAPIAQHL